MRGNEELLDSYGFPVWADWTGRVGGGVRYIGESWDGTDTIRTPDYTLFDAMIRYETGPWRFQVNASNLADKRHVTTCLARGDCFFGIGRTVLGSATYRF